MPAESAACSAPSPRWLTFPSLFNEVRALSFPCDAQGRVDLDRLSERARGNYLRATQAVGRDYLHPVVQAWA
jgi:hypothetical protein